MKCFEQTIDIKSQDINSNYINLDNTIFFDIETTGFSAKNSYLYMIGCLYKDNKKDELILKQWFLDDINTEKEMLLEFMNFIKNYSTIVSFNGEGFDIPFVNTRLSKYKILDDLNSYQSIDLYKEAYKLRKVFKLANLKQKTIEQFLGINREDKFSGGDLISVYHAYLESKDERLLKVLLLHNFEDVQAMPVLLNIFSYSSIFKGAFDIDELQIHVRDEATEKKEFIISGTLHNKLMSRVSFGYGEYYFTAYNDSFKMKIDMYTGGLKYFYKEYKDYYYLPNEDMAVHKSVAFYVDKNFRTKAKAANCYSKKTGNFIPQPQESIEPYFKIEYNDKTTYIELTDEFMDNNENVKKYVLETICYMMQKYKGAPYKHMALSSYLRTISHCFNFS